MANQEKSKGELLQEKLLLKPENLGTLMAESEYQTALQFCEEYKRFLDEAKMEREAVEYAIAKAKDAGFKEYKQGKSYNPGDRVYMNNRDKAVILCTIGQRNAAEGVRIIAAHIDSPRLDLKPRPLFEEAQLAYFKTHYYGGIKKYQWPAIPLALHGVIIKKDGQKVTVRLGEDLGDPVLTVTDLLPHLAKDQMKRTLAEGIKGEELNILIGCHPFKDDKASEKVKLAIIQLLNEKYGVVEADFLAAELCAVPAFGARDVGLDRAMIGAYGHDDRVCAYTALAAALDCTAPTYTCVTVLADKEEVGSDGNTGLNSQYLKYFIQDIAEMQGTSGRAALSQSLCLSADVNCAFDPTFGDVSEKRNVCYLHYGTVISKYTGSGGKYSTNDASAEYMAFVRQLLDKAGVVWQVGELGKVDQGGGGTVAKYISALNVDVVDIGVPVLSMHSPFEVVSKADVYMTYRAFMAFYQ